MNIKSLGYKLNLSKSYIVCRLRGVYCLAVTLTVTPSPYGLRRPQPIHHSGQIAVVLLLFILVSLTIGLAVTQRSLTNITTSSQTEQASRAFSAAEAGLETIKAVQINASGPVTQSISAAQLNNQAQAEARALTQLPRHPGQALEYPPIGKDTIAQIWLADPNNITSPGLGYRGNSVNIYFGDGNLPVGAVRPALEVNLIYRDAANNYVSFRSFYDSVPTRISSNGFIPLGGSACVIPEINTSSSIDSPTGADPLDRAFLCQRNLSFAGLVPPLVDPIMLRIRILYSDIKQPVAVAPVGLCGGSPCSLPRQAAIYTSTGTAGQSRKTLQVFRETNFMPSFLDFAIFSSASIEKL